MTKAEILALLNPWAAQFEANKAAYEKLEQALCPHPENPICDAIFNTFSAYTAMLERVMGVEDFTWLPWYCFDNDMGDKGHEASPGNGHPRRPVRNLDDLAQLILESRG